MLAPLPFRFAPRVPPWETQGEPLGSWQPHDTQVHPSQAKTGFGGMEAIFALVTVRNFGPLSPLTLTSVGPRGWPFGTWTVNREGLADSTAARFGPKRTMSFAAFASNPAPLIWTTSPGCPRAGEMPVTDAAPRSGADTIHASAR